MIMFGKWGFLYIACNLCIGNGGFVYIDFESNSECRDQNEELRTKRFFPAKVTKKMSTN